MDLASGDYQVVALEAPAHYLATDGSLTLVVADPDWDADEEDDDEEDDV